MKLHKDINAFRVLINDIHEFDFLGDKIRIIQNSGIYGQKC